MNIAAFPLRAILLAASVTAALFMMCTSTARGRDVGVTIRLEAPAALLNCPNCLAPAQHRAMSTAASLLSDGPEAAVAAPVLQLGVGIGTVAFAGFGLDLRRQSRSDAAVHYVAL
jgi:hypothetical protein